MDCYDEILKLAEEKEEIATFIEYLTDLINKKSKNLTELQFKNCLILSFAIWNPNFIDFYFREGSEAIHLEKNEKEKFILLLKSEFRDYIN